MRPYTKWLAMAVCGLFGLAELTPVESYAQTKSKTTVHKSATKTKKPVKRPAKSATAAKVRATNTIVPKTRVVTKGVFRPLRNSDRITVISPRRSPRHATSRADLTAATRRTQVSILRTVAPSQQVLRSLTANTYSSTALLIHDPRSRWWGSYGPPSSSYFDPAYGWITTITYTWGTVMYTYGYQVVNYWNGTGYHWVAYPGVSGVAYPVLYR